MRRLIATLLLFLPLSLPAAEAPGRELAARLLAATGTAAVLAHPRVRAALADPQPFLGDVGAPRRQRLLDEAGFREWLPPRVWVLEARREGAALHWLPLSPAHAARAQARGYRLLQAPPLPAAEQAISFLVPGQPSAALAELLGAYEAEVLVLVKGREWALWQGGAALRGTLPAASDLVPELVAELLAARQQWPEAVGRTVVQVEGVAGIVDMTAALSALQGPGAARAPRLIRASADHLWVALADVAPEALAAQLDAEPRLPALGRIGEGASAADREAVRLVSPLLLRQWKPELPLPPAPDASAIQSLPE